MATTVRARRLQSLNLSANSTTGGNLQAVLKERMNFYVGNELEYLERQTIETDSQSKVREETFAPYINEVREIVLNMLYNIYREEPNREQLEPYESQLQYWLKGKNVTVQEFMFEFAKLFSIYGTSYACSIYKDGKYHLYVIDAQDVTINENNEIEFHINGVEVNIRQDKNGDFVLTMGDLTNTTKYNPLHQLIMDENCDGIPESTISSIIGLAKVVYNLDSIKFYKYFNDAFKPLMLPVDDRLMMHYETYYADDTVKDQKVLRLQPEAVMLVSPEGNRPEVLDIGADFVNALGAELKDLRELMRQVVQQRMINQYYESGISKHMDIEQQNIPLFYMASALESFETEMFSTIFDTEIVIIYNKSFTSFDKMQNKEQLMEIFSMIENDARYRELRDTILEILSKDAFQFHGYDSKEVEDMFVKIKVKEPEQETIEQDNDAGGDYVETSVDIDNLT